jgi:uncharacterized cupredoxin-like copper-binding protein
MRHRFVFSAFAALILTCLAPAAEADGAMHDGMGHHDPMKTYGKPGDPKKVSRTVTIVGRDIAYDARALTFKTGETVRFIFVNRGEQPHEFTIGDKAEQEEHRRAMAEMSDMADMDHSDGNSVSTEAGETKELVWTFTKPGAFEFACNYPGHAEAGMVGTITVE